MRPATLDEWLASEINRKQEWVGGQVVEVGPTNSEHDEARRFVEATLRNFTSDRESGSVRGEA